MKRTLSLLTAMLAAFALSAQCSLREISLADRVASSDLVVEGKVSSMRSFWNSSHDMIFTAYQVELYKIFKGHVSASSIEVIEKGGTVGYTMIKCEPSLTLSTGEIGIFTLLTPSAQFNIANVNKGSLPFYEAYGSVQGFIKYDLESGTATDAFRTYSKIETDVYPILMTFSSNEFHEVIPFDISILGQKFNPEALAPSITGFAPSTLTSGTGTVLVITGTGFGAVQGSGVVGFRNADNGGSSYINPLATQYLSWTDTQIQVEVPTKAGTGDFIVTQGGTDASPSTLTVSYAHLNANFDPGTGMQAYQTDHINDDAAGGYTWRMNTAFDADALARPSFMRAFDSWRCNTGVNWTIGATTAINAAASDGTNVICFDNTSPLPSGVLGRCTSYWSGCFSGPNMAWYVTELDIVFDEGSNISPLTWEYGTAFPTPSEYDFETVAVHELGHGHQLGHVILGGAIMHYAISNGTYNRTVTGNDLAGGNFVQAKSIVANICGPGPMTAYSCGGSPPVADFSGTPTTLCIGGTVSFTDLSLNTPTSWAWTFTGGTPSSSTAQNPTITYNTAGSYAVSLIATNADGSDTKTVNGYITVNANPGGSSSVTNVQCNGSSTGAIDLTPSGGQSPYTFLWNPSGQTTEDRSSIPANTYSVTITDANGCTFMTSFVVSQPSALTLSLSKTDATCANNDGTATANPGGGTPSYSYLWAPGAQTTQVATGLASGSYTCTVTDANACTISSSITVNLNCVPNTQLKVQYCTNYNLPAMNSYVSCIAVSGATGYQYRVNGPNVTNYIYYMNSSSTNFNMAWIPGAQYNGTYSIEVRARVGTTWGNYSTVCTLVTPASIPVPSVITSSGNPACPSGASLSTQIFCTSVPGATDYRWQVTGVSIVYSNLRRRNANMTNWYLQWHTGISASQTYDVQVQALVGGVWGSLGPVCTINVPAADPSNDKLIPFDGISDNGSMLTIYPNPFNNKFTIISDEGVNKITIMNMLGEIVYTSVIDSYETEISLADQPSGIYFVKSETGSGMITRKLIKE